ncbi:hypothetical protein I4U23_004910 [Adineta vaga]|nr:hypothetical protein I4U23_004910 [Adineta vaga]
MVKKRNVSLQFARDALENPNTTGILFVIKVDPLQSSTPFASINAVGYYGDEEDEILFSMHSVFRIQNIKLMRGNQRLYQVDVILTSENDNELRILTERIRKDMKGLTEWYGLGEILCKMGYVDKADQIYLVLLNRSRDDREKADIYHQLGGIKDHRGEYRDAIVIQNYAHK